MVRRMALFPDIVGVLLALCIAYVGWEWRIFSPWLEILAFIVIVIMGLKAVLYSPKSWTSYVGFFMVLIMGLGIVWLIVLITNN